MLAYKFRLYPNKEEERKLLWTKEVCWKTYNRFLELYNAGEHDRFKLQAMLPVWKESDADLRGVHSKVLQYELHRLLANLKALNELKKGGRRVSKLRFKPSQRFRTITFLHRGVEKVGQELPELACGHWTATSLSMVVQARWMKQEAPPEWAGQFTDI